MKAAVITCSNRSAAGERADDSGQLLAEALAEWGFQVADRVIVPDEITAIRSAVWQALDDGVRLLLTTGGTGLTPTDVTPEAIEPLLERSVPGIAERIRAAGVEKVATSVLSRGVAGTIGNALVVTLPGSPGGVREGLAVLRPLVHHVLDQIDGGDHRPGGGVENVGGDHRPGGRT